MRILMITPFYLPDLGPSAPLYTMLCEDLSRMGHQVSVIAAVPHYPTGTVAPQFRRRLIRREELNGVDVTRVWVPSLDRMRLVQRQLSLFCYQILATITALRRHYDVLIATNPAVEVGLPFLMMNGLRRRPSVFAVQDIYPDVGVKLGVFKHRFLIAFIEFLERSCLEAARAIQVISEVFRERLRERGFEDVKLTVIPNWVDTDFVRPAPRVNEFSTRWGLSKVFVVMYAGNIGLSQGLEQVLEAGRMLGEERRVRFVFVGDGVGRDGLQRLAVTNRSDNARFIPFQPRELLPQVLASADVSLIALKRGVGRDSVPSKCYSILASGRPVIASVDPESDTWHLVARAECGVCVEPENPRALADAVRQLLHDETSRTRYGANGRAYVVQHHSRTAACQAFHKLLCSLTA